ncbi:hypothetical protein FHE72_22095 [Rossellomorea vietnamensis]|uniref:Membrane-bound protein LytA n=1 Tax=Rossellomorea vietnamensis TaxID=218284 RepID=A0A6I6UN78_9BACI|nr:hypothetical protein [Rossellomorea vietnamensis]QHE63378.1 hypothetical protein FHE72_22095 [Rossellomorea vietnamensis]
MKKSLGIALLSGALLLSGCGTKEDSVEKNNTSENTESADTNNVKTETVIFNGLADTHSMEVKTGNEVMSIQFNPEMLDKIQELEEGEEIQLKYKENEKGQLELVEITEK